ncbi:DNA excision repair protein ERCC-1-like [Biomphalaria glabrata]|uniref:DNA excision repair protein ERCC-1 n=1 Tax=Biomphalaria glabrata TaxID=6526 RepID=A0A9W2ZJW9_BIOGL|nr:DNA excision repair protein ERCC-1-like [Biomphalaria glabrata]
MTTLVTCSLFIKKNKMAGIKKFVVPTVEEMECACDQNPPEPLFKKAKTSSVQGANSTVSQKSTPSATVGAQIHKETHGANQEQFSSIVQKENSEKKDQESIPGSTNATKSFSNSIIVNTRQRGNPILKSIRNIPWEYGNIIPDYVMGQSNCALFLSLRYHQLHPNYIHERLKQLGKSYELRVMLVQVDVKEAHHLLKDLAKICLLADCTLVLAFSPEEAGRYLETYKIFENKPPEAIMEKTEENFIAKFTDCLTRVKSVNKTDCLTLISHFGTLANVMDSSEEDLSLCPGFGPQKAKRLHSIFYEPFIKMPYKETSGNAS